MSIEVRRLPKVKAQTGLSRSGIYEKMRRGTFPAQVRLGPRAVGWLGHEVDAWLEERVRASRPEVGAADRSAATVQAV